MFSSVCRKLQSYTNECLIHLKVNWQFFFIFVFLRSSIIYFTPKVFPSKNVFNLIKSANVFSETKVLPKILSEHIRCTNLHTGGSTDSFMTSYLPFTDIRESCLHEFRVNTRIWNNFVWILWKFITYTTIWVKISEVFYDSVSQNIMFTFAKQSPTLQKIFVLFESILYTEGYYFHTKIKKHACEMQYSHLMHSTTFSLCL